MSERRLAIWTIYDHPKDYPNCFVARLFENATPTDSVVMSPTLEDLRGLMLEMGLVCITRSPIDDPVIVETWI